MARATGHQRRTRNPGRWWLLVGGTLFALAAPAAVVAGLWLASAAGGGVLAQVLAVLTADPTTLGDPQALVSWGVAASAVGTWLVGVGLVLEGLAQR